MNPLFSFESYRSETEWLKARSDPGRPVITSTRAGSILGLAHDGEAFGTPYTVYHEMLGLAPPEEQNELMLWGQLLERPIAEGYMQKTGVHLVKPDGWSLYRSTDIPWMGCSVDFLRLDDSPIPHVVEVKNVNSYAASDWLEGPPERTLVQVQHQLAVLCAKTATVVALIGGNKLVYYDVEADPEFQAVMLEACEEFMAKHIEPRVVPEVTGSQFDTKLLRRLHPLDSGETIELPDVFESLLPLIAEAEAEKKKAEERENLYKNQIRQVMGDATWATLPDGNRISHKTDRRGVRRLLLPR